MPNSSCSFTGYRPNKFDFPFVSGGPEYTEFENKLIDAIFLAAQSGITDFYCGMAWGFDITAGEAVIMLKKLKPDLKIRLIAVVPFIGQEKAWPADWQQRYHKLLSLADRVVYISSDYKKDCYYNRNRYMVDNSEKVITFFDGKSGGTAATIRYAKSKDKVVVNIADIEDNDTLYYSPYIICDDEDI